MAKWKCEICGNEFDNFHAQGFDNKIYCPLCYFKKENQELKSQLAGTTHCFDEEEHNKLKKENQELKKQLHEASLTIQEMTEQDIECPSNCEKLRQLKKQLEEKENIACNWKDSCLENAGKIEILETQQKEFTKFLEDEIKELQKIKETELDYDILKDVIPQLLVCKDVLQKYKEIIGVEDENKS